MGRRLAVVAATGALLSGAGASRGDQRPVQVAIQWNSSDGCASPATLRDEVKQRVRRNAVSGEDSGDVVIRGASGRRGDTWAAAIRVEGADGAALGARELARPGDDCRALDEALIVILAMMVDSSMVAAATPVTAPPPAVDAESPFAIPPEPRPAPPGWRGAIAAVAMTEVGRLPGAAAGLEVAVQIEPPGLFPLEIGAAGWTRASAEADAGGSTFRYLSGVLLACPLRWRRRVELGACAGGQLGAIAARGFGFVVNRRQRELIADARLELRGGVAIAPGWFLRAGVAAWIPLIRPGFSFETDTGAIERLYRPAPVAGVVHFGAGAHFR